MPPKSFDPLVYEGKVATMRRILHAVSHGYYFWTSGRVPAAKAMRMSAKFAELYGVDLGSNPRCRRRAAGIANSMLFLYPIAGSSDLCWWLLVTEGDGAVHRQESLLDTRLKGERLHWLNEYEVARHSRRGEKKPSFTWRMTEQTFASWKERLKLAGVSRDASLMRQAIWSLYRAPGAAVIRQQVGQLVALARREWNRHHKSTDFPPTPKNLNYMSHRADDAQPLSALVMRAKKGRKTWFGGTKRIAIDT